MEQKIEDSHRCGKLDYISDVLEVALSEGSLLVHQWKLEVLENPFGRRRNWQAQFIRLGACETGIRKRGEKYKRRDVSRDDTFGRFNNSRVARGLGVQLSNNEKRSRKRHDRMRRPLAKRRRSSPRHYDGYTSGHNEDDSSDDDSDTRSYASSGFSKPSRSSSYGSRSSVASGSSRSNSEYGSRHRSGRHNKYQTNDQLRKPPSHQPDFKHGYGSIPPDYGTRPPGYGTIPPEGLPYPDEPYPGRSQPHYPYDDRADYTYDDGADNPYDDRADNPYRRS
ncbi:uncharacterized protein EAF01_000236 [Botrytis porri]|uniref:uncharacterized protein n=1 Tax=Botrytis porri TaxID=87229 RepID=UPI0019023F5C|nr:uncharacterized protein EAF01_000236 [Botrytis porri]KAF7913830.1 hypothetical protein EAF01_000236 [Botrytis porri]